MTDFHAARANMIDSQLRPNGITDARILEAMSVLPRELFVPAQMRDLAYMDECIKLRDRPARYLMDPMSLARLIQLASVRPGDLVLHVGCATGYATALLARLGAHVIAIDEDEMLVQQAAATLRELPVENVSVDVGRHAEGNAAHGPYDVILIDGRVPAIPLKLLEQLRNFGRLVGIEGNETVARAMIYTHHHRAISSRAAYDASVQQLPGIDVPRPAFVL